LPVEIAVHPDFRSLPLIYRITRAAARRSRDAGVKVGLGFPTVRHAFIGVSRLGYDRLGEFPILFRNFMWKTGAGRFFPMNMVLRLFEKFIRSCRHAGLKILLRMTSGAIETTEVRHFDEAFQRFWEKVKDRFRIMRIRSVDYLNWKYFTNPEEAFTIFSARRENEILGYIALIIKQEGALRIGYIYDYLSDEQEATVRALLLRSLLYFYREKVDCIKCGILKNSLLYDQLLRMKFQKSSELNDIVYEILVDDVDRALIDNPDYWHVMLSETDWLSW